MQTEYCRKIIYSCHYISAVFDKCKNTYETDISTLVNCNDFPDSEDPDVCSPDPFKRKYEIHYDNAESGSVSNCTIKHSGVIVP